MAPVVPHSRRCHPLSPPALRFHQQRMFFSPPQLRVAKALPPPPTHPYHTAAATLAPGPGRCPKTAAGKRLKREWRPATLPHSNVSRHAATLAACGTYPGRETSSSSLLGSLWSRNDSVKLSTAETLEAEDLVDMGATGARRTRPHPQQPVDDVPFLSSGATNIFNFHPKSRKFGAKMQWMGWKKGANDEDCGVEQANNYVRYPHDMCRQTIELCF